MTTLEKGNLLASLPLKNLAGALLFSVFLGPVGLLYASSVGGITMILICFFIFCTKLMIPSILAWVICSVWSVLAVNRYNQKIVAIRNQN